MAKSKVIYWHRLGLKVYEVEKNNVNLMRDIETTDIVEVSEHLGFLKDSEVYLLLSDAISYLFKIELSSDEVVDDGFRGRLLDKVKADIPEDFANFSWDYKIIETDGNKSVLVFAPIAEVQEKINELSKDLVIKFVIIEPESVAAERNPNPVVGITLKNDVSGKDDEVLNIVVDEKPTGDNNIAKIVMTVLAMVALISGSYFAYTKFFVKRAAVVPSAEVFVVPTVVEPTPTVVVTSFENLNMVVQNGTKTAGKAGKIVDKLKALGVINVISGNADNTNYVESKVYFKDEQIKSVSLEKILIIVPVGSSNILIDNTIENDVKLILGIN